MTHLLHLLISLLHFHPHHIFQCCAVRIKP